MTEQEMVLAVARYLRSSQCRIAFEVPFMSQSIDMVYENLDGLLTAVEFKKHDWSKALEQSRTHLLGADQVYICLPSRNPSARLEAALRDCGIGLMLFDPMDTQVIRFNKVAERTNPKLGFPKSWLREAFERRIVQGDL